MHSASGREQLASFRELTVRSKQVKTSVVNDPWRYKKIYEPQDRGAFQKGRYATLYTGGKYVKIKKKFKVSVCSFFPTICCLHAYLAEAAVSFSYTPFLSPSGYVLPYSFIFLKFSLFSVGFFSVFLSFLSYFFRIFHMCFLFRPFSFYLFTPSFFIFQSVNKPLVYV